MTFNLEWKPFGIRTVGEQWPVGISTCAYKQAIPKVPLTHIQQLHEVQFQKY